MASLLGVTQGISGQEKDQKRSRKTETHRRYKGLDGIKALCKKANKREEPIEK